MKLLVHDLDGSEWNKIAKDYEGWKVLADDGGIHPCIGCFSCWLKTPEVCVFEDAYQRMGQMIHEAEEVVIMTRYTYGGFSSFVKNVMDRSIDYLLPTFVLRKNEMHHKMRYREKKPLSVFFRGHGLTDEQKDLARRYVEAVRTNLNGVIREIRFEETEAPEAPEAYAPVTVDADRKVFLNGSLRGDVANSRKFLDVLAGSVEEAQILNLNAYTGRLEELLPKLASAGTIVLAMPLYVDGIPSEVLRLLEAFEKARLGAGQKIYVISNMGFYESKQIENQLAMVKEWCRKVGTFYCGGLAIGAGGMMGQVMRFGTGGPARNVFLGLDRLAEAVKAGDSVEDIYADAYRFPRRLYITAANSSMKKSMKG